MISDTKWNSIQDGRETSTTTTTSEKVRGGGGGEEKELHPGSQVKIRFKLCINNYLAFILKYTSCLKLLFFIIQNKSVIPYPLFHPLAWVTKTEFLPTTSIPYQADKWLMKNIN